MIQHFITSLPMLVCLFWSAVLWMDWRREGSAAKLRLMVFSIVATMLYAGHFAYFNREYGAIPVTDTLYSMANLMVFPLYYLYIKEVTEQGWKRHWQVTLLVPALITGIGVGACYACMDEAEAQQFIDTHLYAHRLTGGGGSFAATMQQAIHLIAKAVFAIEVVAVMVMGYRRIEKFDEMVENCYADTDERSLRSIKILLMMLVTVSVLSFAANAIGKDAFLDSLPMLGTVSLTFSTLLFLLLYTGHRQDFTIRELMEEAAPSNSPEVETIPSTESRRLSDAIEAMMNDEQLFLKPDLRISDVADLLHTNRNYIYKAINSDMQTSFSDYVNRKRIGYAIQLMKDNPSASAAEIYLKAGFTSQSTFFRNFKSFTGITPKEYLRKHTHHS
ncbi:MAG: helix-turn-helix transcriptional regulator [Prevotella sp.]|nr:helix-turn-helix transcriptional regulator [Prevotella sp.]